MEQVETYENAMIYYEDGSIETRKVSVEEVTLGDVNVNAANAGVDSDDDADINFFEDEMSD